MAKRGNPFSGDGPSSKAAFSGKGAGSNSAVKVTAHERKRPVRRIHPSKLEPNGPEASVHEADNAFAADTSQFNTPQGSQTVMGLRGPSERPANHLKGAISLLNRGRA